jgi:hypothetical protein
VVGVAVAYATLVLLVLAYPCFVIPFKLIGLSMREFAVALLRPFLCAVGMLVTVMILRYLLSSRLGEGAWSFLLLMGAGSVVYIFLSLRFNRQQTHQMVQLAGVRE